MLAFIATIIFGELLQKKEYISTYFSVSVRAAVLPFISSYIFQTHCETFQTCCKHEMRSAFASNPVCTESMTGIMLIITYAIMEKRIKDNKGRVCRI